PISAVAFLPGSTRVAVATTPPDASDRKPGVRLLPARLQVWDWSVNRRVSDVPIGEVVAMAFDSKAARLAAVGTKGLSVWSTADGRRRLTAPAPGFSEYGGELRFSSGDRFLTMGVDEVADRWDLARPKRPRRTTFKQDRKS